MTASTAAATGRRFSEDELRALAAQGADELGPDATPEELFAWTCLLYTSPSPRD